MLLRIERDQGGCLLGPYQLYNRINSVPHETENKEKGQKVTLEYSHSPPYNLM